MTRFALMLTMSLGVACHRNGDVAPTTAPVAPTVEPPPAELDPALADPLHDLDTDIDAIMKAHDVPGLAIAIVHGDAIVHAKGYGVRDRDQPGAVDADTVFAIASNTKAFVATAVGMLVADGTLQWEDRVKRHLPGLVLWDDYATEHMRVRDLLCHRSGLATWAGDLAWIGSKIDTKTLMSRLRHVPAEHDLREAYGYTNLMFVVAGEVIAAATGDSWDAFVRTKLLEPLQMKRTTTTVDGLADQDNVAAPHAKVPGGQAKVPYLDVDAAGAAAALNSSVNDMARWLRMQLGEGTLDSQRIVSPSVVAQTRVPHTPIERRKPKEGEPTGDFAAYGLGWVLLDHYGRFVVTHSGGLPGMTSRVMLSPEDDLGIVVLTNSESSAASQVAKLVLARFAGADHAAVLAKATKPSESKATPAEPPKPSALRRPAAKYAGQFTHSLLGGAVVAAEGDALTLDVVDHGGLSCALVPIADDIFSCAWKDPTLGVSEITFGVAGKGVRSLRFAVRPEFVDPLEYTFSRSRRRRPSRR